VFYSIKQAKYDVGNRARSILIALAHSDTFTIPQQPFSQSASEVLIKKLIRLDEFRYEIIDVGTDTDTANVSLNFAEFNHTLHSGLIRRIQRSAKKLVRYNREFLVSDAIRYVRFLFQDNSTSITGNMANLSLKIQGPCTRLT
jgi:hypothetical protein